MLRVTCRDILWAAIVVAVVVAWWIDRRERNWNLQLQRDLVAILKDDISELENEILKLRESVKQLESTVPPKP